jgi:prepilin-type N-terminal cleavage/methylation domain-containing protein
MRVSSRKAFTLVEIMIVVAIIAIALSIAIPNYLTVSSVSKRTVCINNLKKICGAVEQFVIENNVDTGDKLTSQQEDEIYSKYIRGGMPACPTGGEYIIEPIGSSPQVRCTNEDEGHSL